MDYIKAIQKIPRYVFMCLCVFAVISGCGRAKEETGNLPIKGLIESAKRGDVKAQAQLGVSYMLGKNMSKNPAEGIKWLEMAARKESAEAQYNLAKFLGSGEGVPKNVEQAVQWLRKSADQDFPPAQLLLANLHRTGLGVTKDDHESASWMLKAATNGMVEAQYSVGVCYEKGIGVVQNFEKSAYWYEKAANAGNAQAAFVLGYDYKVGRGVRVDEAESLRWLKFAAEGDVGQAQGLLGASFLEGTASVQKDLPQALKWLCLAAQNGVPKAQFLLWGCYRNGVGTTTDLKVAETWLKKSAQGEFPPALVELGKLNLDNENIGRASECFLKAAELGSLEGQIHAIEIGLRKDKIESYKWLFVVQEQSAGLNPRLLELLQKSKALMEKEKLTPYEMQEAKRRSRAYINSKRPTLPTDTYILEKGS